LAIPIRRAGRADERREEDGLVADGGHHRTLHLQRLPSRQLLLQAGAHVHVRLTPSEEFMAEFTDAEPSREQTRTGMHDLLRRIRADRNGYLALLELRLEANRHPGIREELTRTIRDTLEDNVRLHLEGGFPGDRSTVVTLYLAMTGLFLESLTLPDVLGGDDLGALVDRMVDTIVPPA
jgi:hypothetical protein